MPNLITHPSIIASIIVQVHAKSNGIAFDPNRKLGTRDNFGPAETLTAPLRKKLQYVDKSSPMCDNFATFLGSVRMPEVTKPGWCVGIGPFTTERIILILKVIWYSTLKELKTYWELDTYEFPWDLDWLRAVGIDKIPDDDPTVNPFLP